FDVAAPSTVPSGGKSAKDTKVFIAELVLESIDVEWVVVPKEAPTAFTLVCQSAHHELDPYVLLLGPASFLVNNSFSTKSALPLVHPCEFFTAKLGPDPSIRATLSPLVQKRTQATNGTITFFSRRLAIHNTRPSALPRLVVRDQVPVRGASNETKVAVLAPAGLPVGEDSWKGVAVREGVQARYAQKNEGERLEGAKGDGTIEWVCTRVAAGQRLEASLVWEVSAPTGYSWTVS
ncbi:hypothetical protein DFJ73DRAFT_613330, partial [Zopfochytrium polystomum]